jgi:hypothetical protein
MIDFKGTKLVNDIAGAQTSETEEDTVTGEGIDDHQIVMMVSVAGNASGGWVGDNVAEKDLAWFGSGSNGSGSPRGSADGGNFTTDAERIGFRDDGDVVPDVGFAGSKEGFGGKVTKAIMYALETNAPTRVVG